jgi:tetratricopeptide (TPR) repeat protein
MGTWFRRLLIATGALLWTCNIASAQHADRVTCVSATAPSDQAAAACTRVLARGGLSDTDRAVFLRDRSFVYDRKGEYDKAISDCNEAIRLKPDDAYAFSGRGFAYASKGEYDKAISDCNEAIRLKPDDAYAFDNRGIAYANKGEYDKAISDYDEAIRLKPDDADALEYRANVQVDRHEYDRAIADADEAIRLDLKLPNPHAARSRALLGKGNVSGALAEAEQVVALKPNYMGGLVARGEAEAKNGDLRKALDDFNRALVVIGVDRDPYWANKAEEDRTLVVAALATPPAAASAPPQPMPAAPAGRHVALVVANGAYRDAPLANPGVDADLIKAGLERVGFKVTVKRDLPLDGFEQAIEDFADEAKGAEVALFYFAGHGFSLASGGVQQNLLMATDANFLAKTGYALQSGGESLEHMQQVIAGHAHATLIFIDACRNIPVVASRGLGGRGFAPIDASAFDGAFVVISTRQGKTADDGVAGQGSPFARAVAKILPTPDLRVEDAYYLIRDEVNTETSGAEVPDLIRSDLPKGGLVLAQKP